MRAPLGRLCALSNWIKPQKCSNIILLKGGIAMDAQTKKTLHAAGKIALKALKILWIPAVLFLAFLIGSYIGYQFMSDTSGSDVFKAETWQAFWEQLKSMRNPYVN